MVAFAGSHHAKQVTNSLVFIDELFFIKIREDSKSYARFALHALGLKLN